jgi:hypothetical protein
VDYSGVSIVKHRCVTSAHDKFAIRPGGACEVTCLAELAVEV